MIKTPKQGRILTNLEFTAIIWAYRRRYEKTQAKYVLQHQIW